MASVSYNTTIERLEKHYRACACRSGTPFFGERIHRDGSGHLTDESKSISRTHFQHDRDKILYSPSFRRLNLKTQIFPENTSDHLRTRLLHTLEVAQISRHMARQLQLNEDLVDAIALGHDVGHTPFAHSGERALHRYLRRKGIDGFKHNWQSLRVVDKLECAYPENPGLNLTRAVRIGILKHTSLQYRGAPSIETCTCDMKGELEKGFDPESKSTDLIEVQLVNLADEFAQVVHDLEDAVVSKSLALEEIQRNPESFPILKLCLRKLEKSKLNWRTLRAEDPEERVLLLARLRSELIFQLTVDTIRTSRPLIEDWERVNFGRRSQPPIKLFNRFVKSGGEFPPLIRLDKLVKPFREFKEWLHHRVVQSERVSRMDGKADYIIHRILDLYLEKPLQVHNLVLERYKLARKLERNIDIRQWKKDEIAQLGVDPLFIRSAVDYIAGMTDRYATREYDQLFSAYPRADL